MEIKNAFLSDPFYLTTILIVALLCFIHHSCTYRHAASGTLSFRHRGTFVYSLSFVATSGCSSSSVPFYRSSPFVFATTISARPVDLDLVLWSTSIVSSQQLSSPQPSSFFVPPVLPLLSSCFLGQFATKCLTSLQW